LRWNCPGSVAKRPGPPNLVLILMKGHDPKSIAAEIRTTFVIDETLGHATKWDDVIAVVEVCLDQPEPSFKA
jgi:hypothetical protein